MTNTRIDYAYRDASNYRRSASWTVAGAATEEQKAAIVATLNADAMFVPAAVSIPQLATAADWDDDLDHPFHTIDAIENVDAPSDTSMTVDQLAAAFAKADWDAAGVAATPEGAR